MLAASEIGVFDFVYNAPQRIARLTFNAFSDSRPDEHAFFWFNGPYCEVRRSARQRVILKIKNQKVLEALHKARLVYVAETGGDGVVWNYRMTYLDRVEQRQA